MIATEFNEYKTARQNYSVLTKEELGEYKSGDLRKMVSACGVKNFDRDGVRVRVSSARKDEMVDLIWNACADERLLAQVKTDLSQEALDAVDSVAEHTNYITENDLGNLAQESYKMLREYAMSLYDPATQTFKKTDGKLLDLTGNLANDLRSRNLAVSTTLNYKTTVISKMDEMLQVDRNNPYYDGISEVFRQYREYVNQAFRTFSASKKIEHRKTIVARKEDVSIVDVSRLLDWSIDTLVNLQDSDSKSKWGDVALALMLTTGRRQSEILATAQFAPTDREGFVFFTGQLKTKGRNESAEGYEIPVFAPVDAVINGLRWLELKGKRAETAELAHKRFSRQIIPLIDARNDLYQVVVASENGKGDRLTSHLCRQLYCQLLLRNVGANDTVAADAYLRPYLGHTRDDLTTVGSYMADVKLYTPEDA